MSTISTSGIAPSSVIRAEHVLRVINALSNNANNDILITGSLTVTGSTALSGSLNVTGGITGSIFGTASNATSASYAVNSRNASTASYALTASYAVSASYEINYETSSSYANNATSASYALTSSYALNSTSASYGLSSSYALNSTNAVSATSASYALNSTNAAAATSASYSTVAQTLLGSVVSSSYALTASYALNSPGGGGTTNTGSLLLTASATNNVITFTKGDASTFNITVNTGSASSINTGSFATTGSNQFSGSQGITGSVGLDGGTFTTLGGGSLMSVYSNIITIENQGSPFDYTLLGQGVLTYNSASNSQQLLFPASLTTGTKTITLPNDTGTVALTYNTATTGSNTFRGNQTISGSALISGSIILSGSNAGVVEKTTISYNSVEIDNPTFGYDYNARLTSDTLQFENIPGQKTYINASGIGKYTVSTGNGVHLEFPNLSGVNNTIALPNDGGTVALTKNTVTPTTFNSFTSSYNNKTGSFATTGSNTFTGNQTVNANLTLTSSATMSISTVTGNLGMSITNDQILINPNLNLDRTTLSGGDLQLSAVDGYSGLYLTNRNGSNDTGSIEIHRMQFYGKSTDTYNGLKAGLRVFQSAGTGSSGYINFYTSASSAFGFSTGDLDMRISSGSSIELFRNTTISGSLKQGHLVTASGQFSHAEGYKSKAIGYASHAEGGAPAGTFVEQIGGRAEGSGSHAEGSFTLASGSFSHAEGQYTTASAPWSHAEGLGTITNGWYQHAQGAYNIPSSEQGAFIIGNGVADEVRSNLLFASGELIQVTGSVSITNVLTLAPNNPLPTSQPTGSISVSGSGANCKPYFYNGTTWTSMI